MDRIGLVGGLHHIVLKVALHAVLRPEGGGQLDVRTGRERVQAVRQIGRDRGRMPQQGHAPPAQIAPQLGLGQQTVDAELHQNLKVNESG